MNHIHATNNNILINGKKKRKTEEITKYLLHERAFQMKVYFRNQRS